MASAHRDLGEVPIAGLLDCSAESHDYAGSLGNIFEFELPINSRDPGMSRQPNELLIGHRWAMLGHDEHIVVQLCR
jgi:hypothetical protein